MPHLNRLHRAWRGSALAAAVALAAAPWGPGPARASTPGGPAFVIDKGTRVHMKASTRLTLDCDMRSNGSFKPAAGSAVVINGFGSPQLTRVGFADLQLALHGTASIANTTTVNGWLTLGSGRLSLAGYDLTVNGGISGGSPASYVATPDTLGRLVRTVDASAAVAFPVGNTSYNPLTARRASGSGPLRVAVMDDAATTGLAPTAHIARSWAVAASAGYGATGPLNLTLQWNSGEQGAAFQRATNVASGQKAWRWDGATWGAQAGVLTGDNGLFPAVAGLTGATQGLWTLASADWVSGVDDGALPLALQLAPVWPNPVRDGATVRYGLPRRGHAKVGLYSVRGERIAVLADGDEDAGWHFAQVDSRRIASGVYFLRLEADGKVFTRKVMVVR